MNVQLNNKSSTLELLQSLPIFQGVNRCDLAALADKSTLVHYRKGEVIVQEGNKPTSFYLIIKGIVTVSKISPSGKEFIITTRHQGETLAWGPAIRSIPYFASSAALEDTDLLVFSIKDFSNFMFRNIIVKSRLDDLNIDVVNYMYQKLIDIASDNATQKLIKVLFSLTSKCGNTLNFTHQEIAEMTWMRLETTTRVLTKLKAAGIINSSRGKIIIKDLEKLHYYSENIC